MGHVLEVRDVSISYGEALGVRDCSFVLDEGEILGIAGESGSGKSTLAMSLPGFFEKGAAMTGGQIFLMGKDITPPLSKKEQYNVRGSGIGVVMQDAMSCLDPSVRIGKLLEENIRCHRKADRKEAQSEALELLDMVGIKDPEKCMKKYPFECSGGMQQRICIAAALSGRPRILIADEPTTALDVTVQAQILNLLRRIARDQKMPMLFISHDLGVVSSLCTRVLIMHEGRIEDEGTPGDLFRKSSRSSTRALAEARAALEKKPGRKSARDVEKDVLITVKDIGKEIRGQKILDRVSLQIKKQEVYGLAGESGSGKTTLAKVMQGLISEDDGTVRWNGDDAKGDDAKGGLRKGEDMRFRKAQMIFQDPYQALNPVMTILENLSESLYPQKIRGRRKIREIVQKTAADVGLPAECMGAFPGELSGGQQQRAMIARAILSGPELLICDEAFSSLDVKLQLKMTEMLEELKEKQHLSILFIGHDLTLLRRISDRIGVMYSGMLVEEGAADEIWDRPWHPYTRNLCSAASKVKITDKRNVRENVGETEIGKCGGCPFYRNCMYALKECAHSIPEMFEYEGRRVRCFLYDPKRNRNRDTRYRMNAQI